MTYPAHILHDGNESEKKQTMSQTPAFAARCATIADSLAIAGQALAVEPSFDCSISDGGAMDAICSSDDLTELDLELTRHCSL